MTVKSAAAQRLRLQSRQTAAALNREAKVTLTAEAKVTLTAAGIKIRPEKSVNEMMDDNVNRGCSYESDSCR